MIYDFNIPAKDLSGNDEAGRTLTNVLAEFVGTEGKGDIPKLCHWYGLLMSGKPLELDEPDAKKLIELITNSERIVVFVKTQLLSVLNK